MANRTPVQTRSRPRVVHTPVSSNVIQKAKKMEEELRRLKEEMANFGQLRNQIEQLTTANEQNQDLTRQIQMLKTQNEQQQAALDQLRNAPPAQRVTNNEVISVSGLINALQQTHIDSNAPEFSDEDSSNPKEYIENLENYFEVKNVTEQYKIPIVESKLQGKARVWWDASKEDVITYDDFKSKFLEKFYSIPIQIKAKGKWSSKRYQKQDGSLQTYFFKQVREAKYFTPKLSQFEINYTIIQQLPWRIRDALATVNMNDLKSVENAISYLDLDFEERENDKRKFQNGNSSNKHSNTAGSSQYNDYRSQPTSYRATNNEHSSQVQSNYQNSNPQYAQAQNTHFYPTYPQNYIPTVVPNVQYPPPQLPFVNNNQNQSHNRSNNLN